MTAVYIITAIIIFLFILLHFPLKIYISCTENNIHAYVKYIFMKKILFPAPKEKEEKTKKLSLKKAKKGSDKTAESESDEKKAKSSKKILPEKKEEKIAFIINILKSSGKALRIFTKRISIREIKADIDISDEDACECAIKFGKANIVVYNILSFCSVFFRVKKKYININCVYNKPESIYNFSFTVQFTPSAGILSAIAFIFTFFVNNKNSKTKQ